MGERLAKHLRTRRRQFYQYVDMSMYTTSFLCSMTDQISFITARKCTPSTPHWSFLDNLWMDRYGHWLEISIFKLLWFDMMLVIFYPRHISRRRIAESCVLRLLGGFYHMMSHHTQIDVSINSLQRFPNISKFWCCYVCFLNLSDLLEFFTY